MLLCTKTYFTKQKLHAKFGFCVYNVVQDEFFNQKKSKNHKQAFFVKTIIIILFHMLSKDKSVKKTGFFSQALKFQTKFHLAI